MRSRYMSHSAGGVNVYVIELPERRADRPNGDFLEWHVDEVFKAS
jgi:hypothetical protein